jgi:hypothetical protein
LVADLVDLLIELLLPIQELAAFGLLEGRDHVVADASLVAGQLRGSSEMRILSLLNPVLSGSRPPFR